MLPWRRRAATRRDRGAVSLCCHNDHSLSLENIVVIYTHTTVSVYIKVFGGPWGEGIHW